MDKIISGWARDKILFWGFAKAVFDRNYDQSYDRNYERNNISSGEYVRS